MNHRRLGRANLDVSVIGIGTNQLRRVPERQAIDTLRRAFELGVNLVNTEPDYEGAYDLILAALRECEQPDQVRLSFQAGGLDANALERIFEEACEKFDRARLDLFGITSIADQEAFGANVWGAGGLVEFLIRKKEEGRIGAIFASDHGSPEHTLALLDRNVFDALMLAYNPLGFHLHTVRAKTVWQFETPPVPIDHYEIEDLPRTAREIFPLAKQRNVGLMLMKPLAGGLLCSSKAFPRHDWRGEMPALPSPRDVLRYLLAHEGVSCVVPGMASVEEVEENAAAGRGDIRLVPAAMRQVEARTAGLTRVLCSRCGQCDDLCSQGLPISYLFRAAYHYLYPSAPFAISSTLQYFKLYPQDACVCDTCPAQTCRCPFGIDIPSELKAIHRKMVELRDRGIVPAGDKGPEDWATGRPYSFKVLSQEIPMALLRGERGTVRLHVRNTGTRHWYQRVSEGHSRMMMAVHVDGKRVQLVPLRRDVGPSQECHFACALVAPSEVGAHEVRLDLFDEEVGLLSGQESPPICQTIWTTERVEASAQMPADHRPVASPRGTLAANVGRMGRIAKRFIRRLGLSCVARRALQPSSVAAPTSAPSASEAPPPALQHPSPIGGTMVVSREASIATRPAYGVRYLEHNIPAESLAGTRCVFRVLVENSGTAPWLRHPSDGHGVALALFIDEKFAGAGTPSCDSVQPGERAAIAVTTHLPLEPGSHHLRFEMLLSNKLWFREHGSPSLEVALRLSESEKNRTEELLDIAWRRNTWYFSPGQSIHRSGGRPVYPVFAESSKGCIVTDVDGRQFVDMLMGWGSCLLGHGAERVQAAIARAVNMTGVMTSLPHRLELEAAEALCAWFPWGDEALFGKNGSDVTTWAVRAARIATGRRTILFAGYHGWQDWSVGSQGLLSTGVPLGNSRFAISLPYGDMAALERAVTEHVGDIAAIMIEPAHVSLAPSDTDQATDGPYLERAQALAHEHGALFVLDEIMTGFRFRSGSAQAAFRLTPDLTCLGKALANGMPLSALVGRGDLLRRTIGQIVYAPTMKGEVYSFAAALEALRIYQTEDIPGAVWTIGERIRTEVNAICRGLALDASLIGPPYRMKFMLHGVLADSDDDVRYRTLLQQELARHGVLSHRGYVIPTLGHDHDGVARCVAGFAAALAALREAHTSRAWTHCLDVPDLGAEGRATSEAPCPSEEES